MSTSRRWLAAASMTLTFAIAGTIQPGTASATGVWPPSGPVTWQDNNDYRYVWSAGLDSSCPTDSSCNADTNTWDAGNNGSNQKWYDPSLGGRLYYELWATSWDGSTNVSSAHDLCLDSDSNSTMWGTGMGHVYVIPCNQGNHQKWYEKSTNSGWELQNDATGLCLDAGGDPTILGKFLYTYTCSGGDSYQRFH
ncbi:ricin-type beta-trefoil lectin domain protein [Streptacidiphilus sp. EB129]|uniref:RICIN domain-containing protein n=1 Tax=Streptacidiphilus sp. EB129 TaxID=3156262 RepID=UPI00351641F9